MSKISLIIIFFLTLVACSRTDLPKLDELAKSTKSNSDSLQIILNQSLQSGLFDRFIHFASGGDSGWLDPVRDKVDSNKLDIKVVEKNIKILHKTIGMNDTLISMKVNPDWFKAQNEELGWFLERLKRTQKYFLLIDSLKNQMAK